MRPAALLLLLPPAFALPIAAQEKKEESGAPRVTAFAPFAFAPGAKGILRIRGAKLDAATELRFPGATAPIAAEIKEKKKADVPNGLEAKDVGDTQLEASLELPAGLPPGPLTFTVVTPGGESAPRELRVDAGEAAAEKEPNGGFREAQPLEGVKPVRGTLEKDKDVDVFQFTGQARKKIAAEIVASRQGSLLDPVLTLFDARGNLLGSSDDAAGRDAQLFATLPADGKYFLVLQDAHDRGGAWHAYELTVREMSP